MSSVLVAPRNGIALAGQSEFDFECLIKGAVIEGCLALRDARNVSTCRLRWAVGSDEHQQNEQTKHFEDSTVCKAKDARSESGSGLIKATHHRWLQRLEKAQRCIVRFVPADTGQSHAQALRGVYRSPGRCTPPAHCEPTKCSAARYLGEDELIGRDPEQR
jgi:hypothetical protein